MATNSKYFDSIRIRSGSKAKKAEPERQQCQWAGCDKPGPYRAPAGRNHEGQYLHFCMTHVREYNKNFNYFSGLADEDVAKIQKDALIGNRPTWASSAKLGSKSTTARTSADFARIRSGSAAYQNKLRNPYNNFQDKSEAPRPRKFKTLETKAFLTLGLQAGANPDQIRAQYKALVKTHHPDVNGGDRSSEERFREVLKAYNLLKKAGFC